MQHQNNIIINFVLVENVCSLTPFLMCYNAHILHSGHEVCVGYLTIIPWARVVCEMIDSQQGV